MAAATDSPLSKRRNNISPVWSFFTICDDGRAKCNKCNFKYAKNTSTTILSKHLSNNHSIQLVAEKQSVGENVSEKRPKVKFDKDNNDEITELLLAWIIDDKQAFSVVENSKFKLLLESLNAAYTLPVRQTVANKIDVMFDNKLEFLKVSLNFLLAFFY
jgi:hypothetical protein